MPPAARWIRGPYRRLHMGWWCTLQTNVHDPAAERHAKRNVPGKLSDGLFQLVRCIARCCTMKGRDFRHAYIDGRIAFFELACRLLMGAWLSAFS
jgi:hypothetical protein